MATKSSGSIKGFYRQKKNSGIAKASKPTKSYSSLKKSSPHSASLGSDITQPSVLLSHGSPDLNDDHDENEEVLRQFDMNMAYGPCIGMTRQARWDRACRLGLNPPKEIGSLLKAKKFRAECFWESRV